MIKQNKILITLAVFFLALPLLAQDALKPVENDVLSELSKAYNSFDLEKSIKLLNHALTAMDHFPPEKQIEIYKYAAFITFQNGNSALASGYFWNLLSINPTYSLDPVTTSPKLLTLFQKAKIDYLEDMNQRLKALQVEKEPPPLPWRTLVPGWEQLHRGYRKKGVFLAGAGITTLGGTIYSFYMTRQKKDAYLLATDPQEIKSLYDRYNSFYKKQFYFAYTFAAVWALSQIDLTLWSTPYISIEPSASFNKFDGFELSVVVHLSDLFRD